MATERILIVDDEETLCEVLKINLENEGYDVDTALSAEEALLLDLKKYSLILLDIMMGEISGIKMAKMMFKYNRWADPEDCLIRMMEWMDMNSQWQLADLTQTEFLDAIEEIKKNA